MSDLCELSDLAAVWKNQPEEETAVYAHRIVQRRILELDAGTRSEILVSAGAALLFAGAMLLRVGFTGGPVVSAGIAALAVWGAVSVCVFLRHIARTSSQPAAAADACLEYYRRELERRRDHLRNTWIWHAPVVLACLTLAGVLTAHSFLGFERWRSALPLVAVLALWIGFGIRRRLRQARELQREIDEIQPGATHNAPQGGQP